MANKPVKDIKLLFLRILSFIMIAVIDPKNNSQIRKGVR